MSTALTAFADYAAALRGRALPQSTVHAARRCLIDWFAATIPGGVLPPATMLSEALADELDVGMARLVPTGRRATLRAAALINGTASHTIEFDDIFRDAIYHPGSPVIAAALAVAQGKRASGAALLTAIVAGYEVSTRLGVAVSPAHYEYWHTTGTIGTFGAAVAAGSILNLDAGRLLHALANAGTLAAGLQQAFRSDAMAKPLHAGHAAESGLTVALAAARGFTGAPDILEGKSGFGAAMSRKVDWQAAAASLDRGFNIEQTTQKNHAACGHAHSSIDAVLALRRRHDLRPEHVARVRVSTYGKAIEVAGRRDPRTAFEAQFSLPYCLAVALATGRVRLEAFSAQNLADPALRAVMAKVELAIDPKVDAAFPATRAATVEIETTDGRHLSLHNPTRKGDPDDPLSDAELEDKYRELTTPIIGTETAETLLNALWRIDACDSLDTALRVLNRP